MLLYNDKNSSDEALLKKVIISQQWKRISWRDQSSKFKSVKSKFSESAFKKEAYHSLGKKHIVVNEVAAAKFGVKSLWSLGPKTWSSFPKDNKAVTVVTANIQEAISLSLRPPLLSILFLVFDVFVGIKMKH